MDQQTSIPAATETKTLEKKLVNRSIRILGCLLTFGPTDAARENIAKRILTGEEFTISIPSRL